MRGRKTGGRKKGTPNKVNAEYVHIFAALGGEKGEMYAQELHRLATKVDDPNVRVRALNIIRDYLPWVKMADKVELSGSVDITAQLAKKVIHELHPGPSRTA